MGILQETVEPFKFGYNWTDIMDTIHTYILDCIFALNSRVIWPVLHPKRKRE